MKTLALFLLLSSACLATNETTAVTSREMLSQHETIAVFAGTNYHQCMGLTSMCPDKCGDSGIMATFTIAAYTSYKKPGEYGDPKQDSYCFLVENTLGKAKVAEETMKAVQALKPGDYVLLSWQHDYLTSAEGSKWPERTVNKLQPITKQEAEKKLADLKKLDPSATNVPPATLARPRAIPMAR